MQDRANVSEDFLDLMRQEIIEVIKKYIDIDESAMDVRLTNQSKEDGTQGAPALYANIPILNIKDETRSMKKEDYIEEGVKEKEVKIDNAEGENETANLNNKDEIKEDLNNQTENKKIEESKDKIEADAEVKQDNLDEKTEEEKIIEEEQKIEEAKKIVEENITEQEKSETNEEAQ